MPARSAAFVRHACRHGRFAAPGHWQLAVAQAPLHEGWVLAIAAGVGIVGAEVHRQRRKRWLEQLSPADLDEALAQFYAGGEPRDASEPDMPGEPLDWHGLTARDREMLQALAHQPGSNEFLVNAPFPLKPGDVDGPQGAAHVPWSPATMRMDKPEPGGTTRNATHSSAVSTPLLPPPSRAKAGVGVPQRSTAGHRQRRQITTTPNAARGSLLGRFWLPLCLLFGLAYFAGAQWYYAAHESASRQTRYEQQAIESVALHDRLSGYNPLPPDTDRDVPEPTPETHRALRLELVKEDGSLLKLRLVRSLDWIEAEEAQPGRTVFMDLPEFGAVGEATVLAMEPCPAVPPGSGNLVTGIFEHQADNVIDLYLDGAQEPIGCTEGHRFWSEDREEYVEAGELRPGERVWTRKLGSTAVVGSVPRPGTHRVWNLEVHGEHVYEVGELGVLAHNSYALPTTWRSPKGVIGTFSDGKHKFRIDTHNLSPGERFHVHIHSPRGKEIAVIQGAGTNGIWRASHAGEVLKKPTEVANWLRKDIRYLMRHALHNIK